MKLLVGEIGIMRSCKHENIVEYIDSYLIKNSKLWVVMEYMECGCLTEVLEQFDTVKLSEAHMANIAKQVNSLFEERERNLIFIQKNTET